MSDVRTFSLRVQDPILQKIAQVRDGTSWSDIQLPLAEVVDSLNARMTNAEGQTSIFTNAVTQLAAELPQSGRAAAVSALFNRADFTDRSVELVAGRTTVLEAELPNKADATTVASLRTDLTEAEGQISIDQENLVYLNAQLDGITLGPVPNVFEGATEELALASLDAQTASDAAWLAEYDDNLGIAVRLDVVEQDGRPEYQYYVRQDGSWIQIDADFRASQTSVDNLTQSLNETDAGVTANQTAITNLTTEVATKATAAALTALTNRVSTNETTIEAEQTRVTNLTTTVGTKADTTALTALTNRVATNETTIEAEQTRVTNLSTTVGTKADATALTALTNRVSTAEGEIDTAQSDITTLTTSVNQRATIVALNALTTRVTATETTITAEQTKLTNLSTTVAGKAETTALTALANRVNVTEGDITAINSEITSLESRIVGTALGPATNSFTGDSREAAENARDTYFTNNPTNLASYDADSTINIRLTWGVLRIYQFRRENAWVDNGEVEPTATAVTSLNTSVIQNTSDIETNTTNITANASAITSLRTEVDGIDVSAITELETKVTNIENVDGTTTLAGLARWLVKTQVSDLVGGVGLYNDGSSVNMIVQANRFAVVPPGWEGSDAEERIPFAVTTNYRYVATWPQFQGSTNDQYRTSTNTNNWGPWQNAPANRRVQLDSTSNFRFQVRAGTPQRLSNIETFIVGDTDSAAPSFPAPTLTVDRTATNIVYLDNAAIRNASITGAKITDATITNAKIANATILGAKIANAQIGTAHIVNAAITTAKIGLAQINNAHIINATINFAKIQKGDIFDLTIGNVVQSSNYAAAGTRIPATRASVELRGFTFTARSTGTSGNLISVSMRAQRVQNAGDDFVTATFLNNTVTINLRDDTNSDDAFFTGQEIVDAVNGLAGGVTAVDNVGNGITADFSGLTVNQSRGIANVQLQGGQASTTSTGQGWRIAKDGSMEIDSAAIRGGLTASFANITGTLTAAQVNAIRINADQITAGTISANRIDADNLRSWDRLFSGRSSFYGGAPRSVTISTGNNTSYRSFSLTINYEHAGGSDWVASPVIPRATSRINFAVGFHAATVTFSTSSITFTYHSGAFGARVREIWGVK